MEENNKSVKPAKIEPENRSISEKKAAVKKSGKKIYLILAVIIFLFAGGLFVASFMKGTRAVKKAFDREKEKAEQAVFQSYYEQGYNAGEKEYHVKNRGVITLGNIRETANLEVLSVSDVAYMIENPDSSNKNTQSWIEVPGTGVFTVNLAAGEFLVDDVRNSVYVRVPRPELLPMNINIDHSKVQVLRFASNTWNSSISDGEQLAGKQLNEARTKIQEDISSNLQYYEFAEKSAVSLIENLIKALNTDIPDLKVEIEFF